MCFEPHYESKAKYSFYYENHFSFICKKLTSYEKLCTEPRFHNEVHSNSEMACCPRKCVPCFKTTETNLSVLRVGVSSLSG